MVEKVTSGNNAIFMVASNFSSTFQWQVNNTNLTGKEMNSLTIMNVSEEDEGNYTCIVTTSFGVSIKSTVAQLFVCK